MSWPRPALIDLLGIEHPIIQAPMAGASTAALAAAVSNAGALGGFGGTNSSPDELREVIRAIRQKTNKPFIINLYLDRTEPYVPVAEHVAALKTALAPVHAELHAGEVPDPIDPLGNFDSQIAVVVEERVPVLSSHFGAPDATVMRALKAKVRGSWRRRRRSKRHASSRQRESMPLSRKGAKLAGIAEHSPRRPGRPRSARWRWCRRLSMPCRFP